MSRIFAAAIAVAAIASSGAIPARATTFSVLTPIYFASGAMDNAPSSSVVVGVATIINCTNMSGQTASVRFQFRSDTGAPLAGGTLAVANLATKTIISEGGSNFLFATTLPTGGFFNGSIQVFSTQSAVYCSASLVAAGLGEGGPQGVALHMVRFNPHPGTVE